MKQETKSRRLYYIPLMEISVTFLTDILRPRCGAVAIVEDARMSYLHSVISIAIEQHFML